MTKATHAGIDAGTAFEAFKEPTTIDAAPQVNVPTTVTTLPSSAPDPEAWHVDTKRRAYVPFSDDFERIATTMVVDDPLATYERLETALRLKDDTRNDHASVVRAVDESQHNARLAFRLYATAVRDMRSWELANAQTFAAMRSEATAALENEKAAGARKKMITDADVEAQAAIMFEEQWTDQEMRKLKAKQVVDSARDLMIRHDARARDLQTLAAKLR